MKLEAEGDSDLLEYHTSYMNTASCKDKLRILFEVKYNPRFDLLFDLK